MHQLLKSPIIPNVANCTPLLDTNVPIAAHLSRNPHSPTIELLARW